MQINALPAKKPFNNQNIFAVTIFIQIIFNVLDTDIHKHWIVLKKQRESSAESERLMSARAFSHSKPKKSGFSKRLLFTSQVFVVFHIQIIHLYSLRFILQNVQYLVANMACVFGRQQQRRLELCRTPKALCLDYYWLLISFCFDR